jgi:hypothetical protein
MLNAPIQAAAEYVGVTLQMAFRSVGDGLQSFGDYLQDNPIVLVGAVLGFLLLLRLISRRRR